MEYWRSPQLYWACHFMLTVWCNTWTIRVCSSLTVSPQEFFTGFIHERLNKTAESGTLSLLAQRTRNRWRQHCKYSLIVESRLKLPWVPHKSDRISVWQDICLRTRNIIWAQKKTTKKTGQLGFCEHFSYCMRNTAERWTWNTKMQSVECAVPLWHIL